MLDAVLDYLPSPLDIPAIKGVNPDTDEEEERPASDEEPFAALAFKIMTCLLYTSVLDELQLGLGS